MNNKIQNDDFISLIKNALSQNQTVRFKVKGSSMWPFYKDQATSIVLTKKDEYKKLDVVLATYQNRYVLHRIIKKHDNSLILRGDGAFSKEAISPEDIIGYSVSHETKKTIKENNFIYRFIVILWIHNPLRRIMIHLLRKKK